jgi:hypothetical protein
MAGTLVLDTLQNGAGTYSTSADNVIRGCAKAWVNFTGSSGAINGGYNVSSVTRNSTGNYRVNFTTAMPNANYAVCPSTHAGSYTSGGQTIQFGMETSSDTTTTYVNLYNSNSSGTFFDIGLMTVTIFSS